ncbi:MAG: response regulator [Gemmatimonadetes bacterium]|nr:response regulator [Gemmatimonadota bacterium]
MPPPVPNQGSNMSTGLIVEDDRANREAFSKILSQAGYSIETAENGLEALDRLSHDTFDAIVCDISMPLLSGIGFFEQLEEASADAAGRIVFVTAFADDPRVRDFLNKTGRPVMEKPIELNDLVDAVGKLVAR